MFNGLKKRKINQLKRKIQGLQKARLHSPVKQEDIAKEIALFFQLGEYYDSLRFNKNFPNATFLALESYRGAARLEDTKARYIVGERLLERGKFFDQLKGDIFASPTLEKYAKMTYEEALAYLKAAEEQGYVKAKRLHGLIHINGWGVTPDTDRGFKLFIDSIEMEGAWDRATEIMKEHGLNKPEFFSYIMSNRQKE